jgi:hypothetical protein
MDGGIEHRTPSVKSACAPAHHCWMAAGAPGVAHPSLSQETVMLPLLPLSRILTEPLPPPSWLVEPLISNGSRAVVYGEWGSYKSWGLLDLGLHIAAGQAWLGKFAIPAPRKVLYVDEEMSPRALQRRIKRLVAGMAPLADPTAFQALSRHGVRLNAAGAPRLLGELQQSGFDPDVVIVETLRRVFDGNENEARDVAEFWRSLDVFLRVGKTTLLSHHMKKPSANGGNSVRHRASGSTDILGGADEALAFTRRGKDVFVVEHIKCRDGEEVDPFVVALVEDGDVVTLQHETSLTSFAAPAGKAAQAEQLIEDFLRAQGQAVSTEDILTHLRARNVAGRTGEEALKTLKKAGRVRAPKRGLYQLAGAEAQ